MMEVSPDVFGSLGRARHGGLGSVRSMSPQISGSGAGPH